MNAPPLPRWLVVLILALGLIRTSGIVWASLSNTHGDYYASLPGAYVQTVNPALWDSPDMKGAMGYHLNTYFHGPVQYLTLYPVAWLDSYARIARVLLPLYAMAIGAALVCVIGALKRVAPETELTGAVVGVTLLYFPLLQSFLQREFEVVVLLGLSAALWMLVVDRRASAGVVLGYIAWFKYIPLLFVGYLFVRGWFRAVVAFLLTSVAVLLVTQAVFDLALFFNNNVPAHAAQVTNVTSYGWQTDPAGHVYGTGFCTGWSDTETTLVDVRHGFCSASVRWPWLPPHLSYLFLCGVIAAIYLAAHGRFERDRQPSAKREGWRRALEFSIVTTICVCFFFAHYYYLALLVIPINVLLARYLSTGEYGRLALLGVAYALLSAFVVPTGLLTRALGFDVWAAFIEHGWYLYGELLLMGLLLGEYWALSRTERALTSA